MSEISFTALIKLFTTNRRLRVSTTCDPCCVCPKTLCYALTRTSTLGSFSLLRNMTSCKKFGMQVLGEGVFCPLIILFLPVHGNM